MKVKVIKMYRENKGENKKKCIEKMKWKQTKITTEKIHGRKGDLDRN